MKKIIIIFIIVCCLLSFIEISYSNEEPRLIPFGEFWLKISVGDKGSYIAGFVGGIDLCGLKLFPILTSKTKSDIKLLDFLTREEKDVILELIDLRFYFNSLEGDVDGFKNIINIVTDLYKDPANTYIPACKMIEFAYKKLKGEDMEPLLREARKEALP